MESWFWFCWIYYLILSRNIWAELASVPRYSLHHTRVSFDQASEDCSPGVLTTLATTQEVENILQLVSDSASPGHQNEFTFWVGLRKVKNECVVATPPLRGFKWTEDGSEDSQVSRWLEEPKQTCTTVRCAALKGEFNGSAVIRWGLIPVTCKNLFPFICKRRQTGVRPATLDPATPEPLKPAIPEPLKPAIPEPQKPATPEPSKPAIPEPSKPATPEPQKPATPEPSKPATPEPSKPATPEPLKPASPANPEPRPATQKPEPAKPEPNFPIREPKPETDLKPEAGPDSDPEPTAGSDSCHRPRIPDARSISLDRDNSSRIQVECWSTDLLELHCSGRPAVWRMLDDSPANFTAVCRPCDDGFHKDASGNCVDVDECSSGAAACRFTCLNTEGSYRCFCSDEDGNQHEEASPACVVTERDGLLIPLLVAVAVLLVLVVVIAVTVKCCLMRRSKKHAMKKAEQMAMKSKDGFQTANEKATT